MWSFDVSGNPPHRQARCFWLIVFTRLNFIPSWPTGIQYIPAGHRAMDRLDAMKLFTRVVEAGSLTAVARETDITQPTVSKQLAALEAHLGVQLVHRNARSLRLTEAGRIFYDGSVRILGDVDQIESEVRRGQNKLFGSLTVTVSPGFGRLHLIPRLPAFHAKYPGIVLDIIVSDRYVDLVEEGIDVALRIGDLSDSSLKARLIGSSPRSTFATTSYLEKAGEPRTPQELARHSCIAFTFRRRARDWTFNGRDGRFVFRPQGPFRANDAENVRAAVLAGMGIAQTPRWLFASEIENGQIREILTKYPSDRTPIHAVFPAGRNPGGKLRAFIEFLVEAFAADPCLRPTR
jgi:LysR family transcriptional regulator for bpeEF and oprC